MDFSEWTPSLPARVVDLRPAGALLRLTRYYEGTRPTVVHEVFGQAYSLGAQMAVIEYRYVDPDYRSEHSRFYSITFRRYPSVAHRVHFFSVPPPVERKDVFRSLDFATLRESYLGLVVLRPLAGARVGRVALAPPADVTTDITCLTSDRVNVFGEAMKVRAAPFMAQDAQLGVCAHMALWVVAHHHHLAFGRERRTSGSIADLIPSDLGLGRPAPSSGLTVDQLAAGCRSLGLPPLVYKCREPTDLPKGETIPRIACRYLNSGMPVIVAAGGHHAFTLVGYRRVDAGTDEERIHFVRQDDEAGPYQIVEDFAHDPHGRWEWLIVPLPQKVFLPGEAAESLGAEQLLETARESGGDAEAFAAEFDAEPRMVSFRSTVVRSNRFKETMTNRGFEPEVAELYRRMPLARWVWVVEAIRGDEWLEELIADAGLDVFPEDIRSEVDTVLSSGQSLEPAVRKRFIDAASRGARHWSLQRKAALETLLFEARRGRNEDARVVAANAGIDVDLLLTIERGDTQVDEVQPATLASWAAAVEFDRDLLAAALRRSLVKRTDTKAYAAGESDVRLPPEQERFVDEVLAAFDERSLGRRG